MKGELPPITNFYEYTYPYKWDVAVKPESRSKTGAPVPANDPADGSKTSAVVPAVAGPKRPQDRIDLPRLKEEFVRTFSRPVSEGGFGKDAAGFASRVTSLRDVHGE